jgi:hypothetical protein
VSNPRLDAVVFPQRAGCHSVSLRMGRIGATEATPGTQPRWLALRGLVNMHAHADRNFAVQSFRPASP